MDIWLVSSLQLPGEGEEDAYLEFQGASGTYLPWCPTVPGWNWNCIPTEAETREAGRCYFKGLAALCWDGLLQNDPSTVYNLKKTSSLL